MKLSKNALARVDEYVRELLILPSRAESRDLTDVVAEMQTDRAKAKAKAKANPAKANPAKANPAKDQAVNPYELQRDQNIARNKERMAALNIRSLAGAVQRRQPSGGGKGEPSPPVEASAGGVVEGARPAEDEELHPRATTKLQSVQVLRDWLLRQHGLERKKRRQGLPTRRVDGISQTPRRDLRFRRRRRAGHPDGRIRGSV